VTYVDNTTVIYNIQVWFRQNCIDNLPNDSCVWASEFRQWLAEQGGEIELNNAHAYLRNSLEIAPGYDRIKFERNEDATVFLLRWS
jgi:hypothetical protein